MLPVELDAPLRNQILSRTRIDQSTAHPSRDLESSPPNPTELFLMLALRTSSGAKRMNLRCRQLILSGAEGERIAFSIRSLGHPDAAKAGASCSGDRLGAERRRALSGRRAENERQFHDTT
jgi:hypothetical protein